MASTQICVSQPAGPNEEVTLDVSLCPSIRPANAEVFVISDAVTRAEIRQCLLNVHQHRSLNSAKDDSESLKLMFPDSKIAQGYSQSSTKMANVLSYGLGPLIKDKLNFQVKKCRSFTAYFDESRNRDVKEGQMDLHVRFFDPKTNLITTSYFNSVFFERSKAQDLLNHFKHGFEGMPLDKMIQVSMEGPSVTWSFLSKLEEELVIQLSEQTTAIAPPGRFELGSCGLHVVHGAFRSGHDEVDWKVQQEMEPCRGRHISVNRFYHLPFRSGRLFHPGISKQAEPIRQKDPPQERRSCTICSFSIFCRRGVVVVQFSRLPILPPSPPHLQYPLRHNVLRGRPTPNCWNKWFTKR